MRDLLHLPVLVVSLVGLLIAVSPGRAQEEILTVWAQFTAPAADQPAGLFIAATIKRGWHIYSITQAPGGPKPTRIELDESEAYELAGDYRVSPPPERKKEEIWGNLTVEAHYGVVTWQVPIRLAAGVDPAELEITGQLTGQACKVGCRLLGPISFTARLGEGLPMPNSELATVPGPDSETTDVWPSDAQPPGTAVRSDGDGKLSWRPYTTFEGFRLLLDSSFDPDELRRNINQQFGESSLLWTIILGFAGGIVLNLMPCVLPVIGLKILSFVEQAGHDRRRALMLNIWYSAGLLSIFLVLATLAVFLNLGWGHLFKYAGFNIFLAAMVFAMGLSFLGVWEIPIPGFVGTGKAADLAGREGFSGAFSKGVITTILATPCTGPFMGSALAWAVKQPPANTYAVFTSVGLGMASPYLLVGAFPALISFLPKPGAWMDTFKKIMGFVLLGTVVYIFTFLQWPYVVPTVGLLFALGAGCWWIARTPLTENFGAKARAWLEAASFVGVAWILLFPGIDELLSGRFAFSGLHEVMEGRFEERIQRRIALHLEQRRQDGYQLVATGRKQHLPTGPNTVLVDFTADWCPTCKTLEAQFLDTPAVRKLVSKNRVVMVKADWTHQEKEPEVTKFMDLLGARQVPQVLVLPANDPNRPTALFRDGYTEQGILGALKKAGPSRPSP